MLLQARIGQSAGGGKLEVTSHRAAGISAIKCRLQWAVRRSRTAELALSLCTSSHEHISTSQHCLPKSRPATRRKACAYRFLARWTTHRPLTRHDALDQAQICLLTAEVRSERAGRCQSVPEALPAMAAGRTSPRRCGCRVGITTTEAAA